MDLDLNDPDVKAAVEAAAAKLNEGTAAQLTELQQSISKLEGNNSSLVKEKRELEDGFKSLKDTLDSLGGEEGVTKLKEAQAEGEKKALLQKLIEGNIEEFTAAITEKATTGLTKQIETLTGERDSVAGERDGWQQRYQHKLIEIEVRDAATKAAAHPTAIEDIVARASAQFSMKDDAIVCVENDIVKIGADGKTPYSVADWLEEQREAAPHWWPASQGGGASGGQGGGQGGSDNPWSKGAWNLTKQGEVIKSQGNEKAQQMAKAAGSYVGAPRPPA